LLSQQDDIFNFVIRTSTSDDNGNVVGGLPAKGGNVNLGLMHVVATYDGINRKIYIDGVQVVTDDTNTGNLDSWDASYYLTLGDIVNGDGSYAWFGEFKLLSVYSVTLTPTEVLQNYNEGITTPSVPTDPTNLSVVVVENNVTLTWIDNADNEDNYVVQRDSVQIASLPPNSTLYEDINLSEGLYVYRVFAKNSAGNSDYIEGTANVGGVDQPPVITDQTIGPVNINEGQPLELYITAVGSPPPTYQWYKDLVLLYGEIESTYTVGITTIDDNGSYYCIVSNGILPNTQSETIDVYINKEGAVPVITDQPLNQRVAISPDGLNVETAVFDVAATGEDLTYQWYKNGIALEGETAPVLQYPNSTPADDGSVFTVVVTNPIGSTISDEAILSVYTASLDLIPISFEYILVGENDITLKWIDSNTEETNINYELWASDSGLYGEYFKIADILSGTYTYTDTNFSAPGQTRWYYINSYVPDEGKVSQASERVSGTLPGGVIGVLSIVGPDDVEVPENTDAVFNISVVGGSTPYTYQWYEIGEGLVITGPDDKNIPEGNDAIFNITVVGGSTPYTYQWYEIGEGTTPQTLEVTGPDNVNSTEGTDAVFNVTVTGGQTPYRYIWYELTEEI